jgi:hypothetical protein
MLAHTIPAPADCKRINTALPSTAPSATHNVISASTHCLHLNLKFPTNQLRKNCYAMAAYDVAADDTAQAPGVTLGSDLLKCCITIIW